MVRVMVRVRAGSGRGGAPVGRRGLGWVRVGGALALPVALLAEEGSGDERDRVERKGRLHLQ